MSNEIQSDYCVTDGIRTCIHHSSGL